MLRAVVTPAGSARKLRTPFRSRAGSNAQQPWFVRLGVIEHKSS